MKLEERKCKTTRRREGGMYYQDHDDKSEDESDGDSFVSLICAAMIRYIQRS